MTCVLHVSRNMTLTGLSGQLPLVLVRFVQFVFICLRACLHVKH